MKGDDKSFNKDLDQLLGEVWRKQSHRYRIVCEDPDGVPLWFIKTIEGVAQRDYPANIMLADTPFGEYFIVDVETISGEEMLGLVELFGMKRGNRMDDEGAEDD